MENNNKESFTLLGMSASGSDSESIPEFVAPRKRKVRRRVRGSSGHTAKYREPCSCNVRTCGLSLAATLLLCWLIILSWLAVVLHSELKRLHVDVNNVVAGSQGVTDALQKYHSLSKGLQQNQTVLFTNLELLKTQLTNFSAQVSPLQYSLHELQEKLKAAPALVNVPQNLEGLKSNVASFGSQIRDFNTTVAELKIQNKQLQDTSEILVKNLTTTELAVAYLQNVSKQLHANGQENDEHRSLLASINQLSQDVTRMNESLNGKFQWIEGDAEDQKRDHKNLEKLQELGQNVSARITTLEGECVKTSAQTAVLQQVQNITERVTYNEGQLHDLNNHLQLFQNNYSQLILTVNSLYETITHLTSSVLPTQPTKITETP